MTTAALSLPAAGRDHRPGLGRLTLVELRKMTDTRAGFWLLLTVLGLTVFVVVAGLIWGEADDQTLQNLLGGAIQPSSILLPIVGILLASSEWSQRTAQITFTLVPRRSRVLGAKLLAGTVLAFAALLACIVIAVLGTAIGGSGVDGTWSLSAGMLGQDAVYVVTAMLSGVAIGALLLASAPAIVVYFAAPLAWTALGSLSFLEGAARWLDGSRTLTPMYDHLLSSTEWARAGATLALWMLLPLLGGLWRLTRSEVR